MKLKQGKCHYFVKSRLMRYELEDDVWEADYAPIPGERAHLGIVVDRVGAPLYDHDIRGEPTVNNLADLLARAIMQPMYGEPHRPRVLRLRNKPEWAELLPHLGLLGIEVRLVNELPLFEKTLPILLGIEDVEALPGVKTIEKEEPEGLPVLFTLAQRKLIAEVWPEFSDGLHLDVPHRTLYLNEADLQTIHDKSLAVELHVKGGTKRISLRHVIETTRMALARAEVQGDIPVAEQVFQFRIALRDSNPPIWRRIQVKNASLDKLHEAIQLSMDWENSHLHHFKIDDEMYGDPSIVGGGIMSDNDYNNSKKFKLKELFGERKTPCGFEYEYDFGDSWFHDVEFEGVIKLEQGIKYPRCVDGARQCPPEDVGGIHGYQEFLEALADPKHERHNEFRQWIGGRFDPEAFSVELASMRMQKGLRRR